MRLLVVLALVLAACKGRATPSSTGSGAGSAATNAAPISEADARAFAEQLVTEVMPTCDESKVAAKLSSDNAALVARLFCEWVRGISHYKVIGVRNVKGQIHPITRRMLTDPDTEAMFVNYDELVLVRTGAGELRLADVFSFRQAVWLSELLAANATGGPTDYLGASAAHPEVRAARDQMRNGDRAGALKAIDALPPPVRSERGVQMLRVRVAVGLGPDAYKQALGELAKTFPDDPAIALIQIDGSLDANDADAAMHWIDVLEKVVGIDAYLESMRVVALVRKGELDKALEIANAAIALEPTLTRALEIKMDVLIARKQWPDVLQVMTELETKHDQSFDVGKLRSEPRLAELVRSPAFTQWLQARTP